MPDNEPSFQTKTEVKFGDKSVSLSRSRTEKNLLHKIAEGILERAPRKQLPFFATLGCFVVFAVMVVDKRPPLQDSLPILIMLSVFVVLSLILSFKK